MHRRSPVIVLFATVVALVVPAASAAASATADPVSTFQAWAGTNGFVVEDVACSVASTGITTCYGLYSDDPAAADWSGVLVGVAIDDSLQFTQVQSFPAAPSAAAASVPAGGASSSFGDGTWLVGTDIAPGTYRVDVEVNETLGMAACIWARLSGVSGDTSDWIANGVVTNAGPQVVEIAATDVAFQSQYCGTWTLVQ